MLKKFLAFYPGYLAAHQNETNQRLHFTGATLCFLCIFIAIFSGQFLFFISAILLGYLFPHVGHKHYEGNNSMRASHPVFCVMGATLMYFQQWGKLLGFRS